MRNKVNNLEKEIQYLQRRIRREKQPNRAITYQIITKKMIEYERLTGVEYNLNMLRRSSGRGIESVYNRYNGAR